MPLVAATTILCYTARMTKAEEVAKNWAAKENDLARLLQLVITDFTPKKKAYSESLETIRKLIVSAHEHDASVTEIMRATGFTRGFIRNILGL